MQNTLASVNALAGSTAVRVGLCSLLAVLIVLLVVRMRARRARTQA